MRLNRGDSIQTYKPDPAMYKQGIRLSRLPANKVAMVAAHAYDLDAAKSQYEVWLVG